VHATKQCPTVGTLTNDAQGSGITLCVSVELELAAFLGGHVVRWFGSALGRQEQTGTVADGDRQIAGEYLSGWP